MPFAQLVTNQPLGATKRAPFLHRLSEHVSTLLGKPERYVMVTARDDEPLLFGGSDAPAAYLELASLGLREDDTAALSAALCAFLGDELDVPGDRIYIQFVSPERAFWGWDGRTF